MSTENEREVGDREDEAWSHHGIETYHEHSFRAGFRAAASYAANEIERMCARERRLVQRTLHRRQAMSDPLHPNAPLLAKLGSIAVHAQEAVSPSGHYFDVETIRSLLSDPAVDEWLTSMRALAMLPVLRSAGEPTDG